MGAAAFALVVFVVVFVAFAVATFAAAFYRERINHSTWYNMARGAYLFLSGPSGARLLGSSSGGLSLSRLRRSLLHRRLLRSVSLLGRSRFLDRSWLDILLAAVRRKSL